MDKAYLLSRWTGGYAYEVGKRIPRSVFKEFGIIKTF